ncbi:hypothetical protein DXG03_002834 [Asterophora parasitica]|uniref:Uncharacterized protein n=1 Tax=Asterophora parasitica TaxID=117018 RepID=A0A9P7G8F2_9AGAR|nr:hypothetical protein DXG03_002834 [Asterophora parasitica]
MADATRKRKNATSHDSRKRLKLTTASGTTQAVRVTPIPAQPATILENSVSKQDKGGDTMEVQAHTARAPKKRRINKLVPPRPFPTVPTSVSATGPRSAHKEGKNFICLSRKTPLGAYMRRCKDIILNDGYKTLHFSAMGAAIPLLLQLLVALPPILPFAADEIRTEVTTGTVEVQDEVIPDDEDEDVTYETRGKSTLKVIFKIGNGEFDGDKSGPAKKNGRHRVNNGAPGTKGAGNRAQRKPAEAHFGDIVLQEPEQEEMEML